MFKVQKARQGSRLLAKVLVLVDGEDPRFEYVGAASRFVPAGTVPMSLEEAKDFGRRTGVCCSCGATLTKEESIARGLGPVCAGKFA